MSTDAPDIYISSMARWLFVVGHGVVGLSTLALTFTGDCNFLLCLALGLGLVASSLRVVDS